MRVENGPFGSIGVISLRKEDIVLPHQLHIIENHTLDSVALGFIRHSKNTSELCFDITGLQSLFEVTSLSWSEKEKKEAFCRFLRALIAADNHYLDLGNFLFEEENIFFDPSKKMFIWCYLPIMKKEENTASSYIEKLEQLLFYPLFRNLFRESQRLRFISAFSKKNEEELQEILSEIEKKEEPVKSIKRKRFLLFGISLIFLIYILLSMVEAFFPFLPDVFGELFLFLGLLGFVSYLLFSLRKEKRSRKEPDRKDIPRELLFPKEKEKASESYHWPPMFLLHLENNKEYDSYKKAVILTDSFSIGRDRLLCDYFVNDDSLSEIHIQIERAGGQFFLSDLDSTQGTWLKNQRLAPHHPYPLQSGDILRLGEVTLLFTDGKEKEDSFTYEKLT